VDSLRAYANEPPDLHLDEITYAPPIPKPDKILCVGLNYLKHMAETGEIGPRKPMLFTRFANTQVGHGQTADTPLAFPTSSISKASSHSSSARRAAIFREADALSHVAGYACYNDGSVRDCKFTPRSHARQEFPQHRWIRAVARDAGRGSRHRAPLL